MDPTEPKPAPEGFPITPDEILADWDRVLMEYGGRNMRNPFITYDPDSSIGFEIHDLHRVIFNLAKIPVRLLPPEKVRWWFEFVPLRHEWGHYHICPYSGEENARHLCIIREVWPEGNLNSWCYAANYGHDLIVNYYLFSWHDTDFRDAMVIWFQENDLEAQEAGQPHSSSWTILVRIHELVWHNQVHVCAPSVEEERVARKVYAKFMLQEPVDQLIRDITVTLLPYFQADMKHQPFPKDLESFFMEVPFSSKSLAKVSDQDPETEHEKEVKSVLQYCGGAGPGTGAQVLEDLGLASTQEEAHRLWLHYLAQDLIHYEPKASYKYGRKFLGFRDWNWGDRFQDWNLGKSLSANPAFPFPPYAQRAIYGQGKLGLLRQGYRDCLLIIDTSGSMGELNCGTLSSPADYATLSMFAALQAAADRNVSVALINFSSTCIATPWLLPTHGNLTRIELTAMHMFKGGTQVPGKAIRKLAAIKPECCIVMITDLEVFNESDVLTLCTDLGTKHPWFIFRILTDEISLSPVTDEPAGPTFQEKLEAIGVHFFPVKSASDLPGITIRQMKRVY
jgi:hypothetical protein